MFDKIKNLLKASVINGLYFPFAHDPVAKKPSVTLFMAYVSFYAALISLIALHYNESLLVATGMAFVFNVLMIVFYLIRTVNRAKFDLDDKSFEISNNEGKNNETDQ